MPELRWKQPWSKLRSAWNNKPTAVTVPLAMIPIGIAALILGEDASRAFTEIGGGVVIRFMGAVMLAGGTSVLIAILRDDPLYELIGLVLAALGAAIYGTGVILGLGTQGVVAGIGYLAMSAAFLGRIRLLMRAARELGQKHGGYRG